MSTSIQPRRFSSGVTNMCPAANGPTTMLAISRPVLPLMVRTRFCSRTGRHTMRSKVAPTLGPIMPLGFCVVTLPTRHERGCTSIIFRLASMALSRACAVSAFRSSAVTSLASSGRGMFVSRVRLRIERPPMLTNTRLILRGEISGRVSSRSIIDRMRVAASSAFCIMPKRTVSGPSICSEAMMSSCTPSVRPTAAIIFELLISIAAT